MDHSKLIYLGKVLFLALLYIFTGKLGLLLAVPPGYATIIWPPSGIALGFLVVHGWRLWPGVFIGSIFLNAYIKGALSGVAISIAFGSTIQVLVAYMLLKRFIGLPLSFKNFKQIILFFILSAPVACLTAATISISALHFLEGLPLDKITYNWTTWWLGDLLGVVIFFPLMLLAPGSQTKLSWKEQNLGNISTIILFTLLTSYFMTFYTWKLSFENIYTTGQSNFQMLAIENEKALYNRLNSYQHAIVGAAAFYQGSDKITQASWENYVDRINLKKNFPGMNGINIAYQIQEKDLPQFLEKMRLEHSPAFTIKPETTNNLYYIISFFGPMKINKPALGLNLSFEKNRLTGLNLARDSGKTCLTKTIRLVQDSEKTPGFLIIHPLYKPNTPTSTEKERQNAFIGWVNSPFIAKNFFTELTNSQGNTINVKIYDGEEENDEALIFDSNPGEKSRKPTFLLRKTIDVFQQKWTIIWASTSAFEQTAHSDTPFLIILAGLLFTGLFGVFIFITSIQRTETLKRIVEDKKFILPLLILVITTIASYALYYLLQEQQHNMISSHINDETNQIEVKIKEKIKVEISNLTRLARHLEANENFISDLWKKDTNNYLDHISGLKYLEWIDKTHIIREIFSTSNHYNLITKSFTADEVREKTLKWAQHTNAISLTPPVLLSQDEKGIMLYMPLQKGDQFDGFLAGAFALNDLFNSLVDTQIMNRYAIYFIYNDQTHFKNKASDELVDTRWTVDKNLDIVDKKWKLRLVPTHKYIESRQSILPLIIFIAGVFISILMSLTVRYILIARLRLEYLKQSEERYERAVQGAKVGLWDWDLVSGAFFWSPQFKEMLGITDPNFTPTYNDFIERLQPNDRNKIQDLIKEHISLKDAFEIECLIRHNSGQYVWVNIRGQAIENSGEKTVRLSGSINDITQQKEIEKLKSDFISTVSHELRTPLTSIRGSLGLILGNMSKELSEKASKLIDIAYQNSERLLLLINDILDIEKIAAGQMKFNMTQVELQPLLQSLVDQSMAFADKYDVLVELSETDSYAKIFVDPSRLTQILSNLITNAIKFSPKNGKVHIFIVKIGDNIRISVHDTGTGIPHDFRERLFEKFSQANSSSTRSQGGTGLGLHISKELTENMGGTIGYESTIGQGTTFWVEFKDGTHDETT